jgi:hypothetical protein
MSARGFVPRPAHAPHAAPARPPVVTDRVNQPPPFAASDKGAQRDSVQHQYGNAAVVRAGEGDKTEPAGKTGDIRKPDKVKQGAKPKQAGAKEGESAAHAVGNARALSGAAKERRLERAARQLKLPPKVADPEPLPPVALPMPMPLNSTASFTAFAVLPSPQLDTQRWSDRNSEKHRAVVDSARREYASISMVARARHDRMASESNTAVLSILVEYSASRSRIESDFLRSDSEISLSFDRAMQTVRSGAEAAHRTVIENYLRARDALSGAAAQMKKKIKDNAASAAKQTDDIIAGLAKDFIKPLEEAGKECTDKSTQTRATLVAWKGGLSKRYPLDGEPAPAVENEAMLGTANTGVDEALKRLAERSTQISGLYTANITQVSADIRARIGPSLQVHAAKIEPEGTKAVNEAFNKAYATLQRNANDALKATAESHKRTIEQLAELRRAERQRLEAAMQFALTAAHDEAQTACTTLQTTAQSTLPHYGQAVDRLHSTMTESAPRGPQVLAAVTATSPQIVRTLDQAQSLQQRQIETVRSGTISGLAAREQRTREENVAAAMSADSSFTDSSVAASADMAQVAQLMTEGLTSLSQGVIAAAGVWVRPLAQAFATFLAEVDADLTKGWPAFIGRVNTSKRDYLKWLAPQSNPAVFFAADLLAAAKHAREKVAHIVQEVAASLDSGIFDKVNEERLGNALRPLTRLQGRLVRALWPKTWPDLYDHPLAKATYIRVTESEEYTLDGHLLVALGPGSDDYNAAINYLNGNTAEGARYELEASMHWYNDEEGRIEGIMRGLTKEQLAQLHNLPAYQGTSESEGTKQRVQDALGGTDLNVFNALDEGNHAKADAYRMRDELDSARDRRDKGATNEVLAKYSNAAQYGGVHISGEDRRAAVQREFAAIQGIDIEAKAAELGRQRAEEAKKAAPPAANAPGTVAATPVVTATAAPIANAPAVTARVAPIANAPAVAPTVQPTVPSATASTLPARGAAATTQPVTPPPATAQKTPAPTPSQGAVQPTNQAATDQNAQAKKDAASLADRWMTGAVAAPSAVVSPDDLKKQAAAQALFEYSTRTITRTQHTAEGSYEERLTFEGRDRDLAHALIFHGEGSPEARAAQLGFEMQRSGKPDILKVDTALVDPRLNPDLPVKDPALREQIRQRALEDRKRMLEIYARDYGGLPPGVKVDPSQVLIWQLESAFGSDEAGANLAARLVREEYPTPETASYAMEYAIVGAGTNNELIDRTLGRMNRDEVKEMREKYKNRTSRDLYADLGVFGRGTFGDLSGDDRLRAERMLLGVPRNDKERAEVAAFTIKQQRDETGIVGGWLASGSLQDIMLTQEEKKLNELIGGPLTFGPDGEPQWSDTSKFRGNDFAGNAGDFAASIVGAEAAAQNYSAKIDQYANAVAMGIAVIGAIVAAVVAVMTGGAASPLLMAAIAGITGLAAMGAQRLIKGGRYGWEDAVTDLGMTAVSMMTAGVGQVLSLASRGGMVAVQASSKAWLSISAARQVALKPGLLGQMGRLTGSAYLDKVLIGASTGTLGAFGQAALQEQTWKDGKGIENLFAASARGFLGGGVTAGVTNAIEDVPLGRLSRVVGGKANIGDAIGQSTNALTRGTGKAVTSSIGAAAGRATELSFDKSRGQNKMDAGDIFVASLEAGGHSFLQSFGEGAAEARQQAIFNARAARAAGIETPGARLPPQMEGTRALATEIEPGVRVPIAEQPELARPTIVGPDVEAAPELTPPPKLSGKSEAPEAEAPTARRALELEEESALMRAAPLPAPDEPLPDDVALRALEREAREPATVRPAVPEKEGAAAAIPGSRLQLQDAEVGAPAKALHDAVDTAITKVRALAGAKVEPEGDARIVSLTRADEQPIRVRVVFGETKSGDVASFRPGTPEENVAFVVIMSKRAPPDLFVRAIAHELAELRFHALPAHAQTQDLLTARAPGSPDARLSAHDVGRLAELEVLAAQLAAARKDSGRDSSTARQLESDIDALAAHLGLLHAESADRRFVVATEALGGDSPAGRALNEARIRASQLSVDDALHPARAIDDNTRLTAADRKRLAQLEELGQQLDNIHGGEPRPIGPWKVLNPEGARLLELEASALLATMGLLATDEQSARRARLAATVFEPESPGARLLEHLWRTAPEPGGNDVLRSGGRPDERTVPSAEDLQKAEELRVALRNLVGAEQTNQDAAQIARLRHIAEAKAAEMGLVHGDQAADLRTQFLLNHPNIPQSSRLDGALAARLAQVRISAQSSPLLRPRQGTIDDLGLLARQVAEARAMGDERLALRLTEIAGFRLEEAEMFVTNDDARDRARSDLDRVIGTDAAARALADDALARHGERLNAKALRAEADSTRVTLGFLQTELAEIDSNQARAEAAQGKTDLLKRELRTRRNIRLLEESVRSLEAAAASCERVAFRPGGRTAEEARAAANDPNYPTKPQYRHDPDYAGSGTQQKLARQRYGDSPLFQSWERFKQIYAEVNETIKIGGSLVTRPRSDDIGFLEQFEQQFRNWLPGRFVGRDAKRGRFLPDSPLIRAAAGADVEFNEPGTDVAARLAADERVNVKDREMSVTEAEAERRALINERNLLAAQRRASEDATEQETLKNAINLLVARINDVSEALGEAAGRRFAALLPGGPEDVTIDRGAGVPDVIHIDPVTQRVTVIECKGGTSELGSRNVGETLGRAARAEQTTPEYLRDLAREMTGPGKSDQSKRIGNAILRALGQIPPNIDVFVVRQPFDENGSRGSIQVTQYPVTRSGM